MIPLPLRSTLFPYTTLFRSSGNSTVTVANGFVNQGTIEMDTANGGYAVSLSVTTGTLSNPAGDRKSTSLNSSQRTTSYAEFDKQRKMVVERALMLNKGSADQ